jgi:hypothetical protein
MGLAGQRVRSLRDGQLGYLVEGETGALAVRLDRKAENRVVPFVPSEWTPDKETRLSAPQIARVAYEADRALRLVTGEYGVPDWISLREPVRLAWAKGLPAGANEIRTSVYRAILKELAK